MSDLAPILTSAVGLMGAMVAGLSVYLNYKSRHNLLRQVVYGRQMDAYFNITESMSALYTATLNAMAVRNPYLGGEDAGVKFRAALREEHERFTGTVNRSLIVLPSKVKAAVDQFNETLLAIGDPQEERNPVRGDSGAAPKDPAQEIGKAYERALNSIRYHLAIDSLTTGMLKEMGIGSESVTTKSFRHRVNPLVPVGRGGR
ncbi:MAG: hypothetical protein J2P46_04780 [Zavarzinella sp.]|nr:hypothetical protein [Zavarzinella sp.]